jgi:hypothetical protein
LRSALLRLTIVLACIVAVYQAVVFHLGSQPSRGFNFIWAFTFTGLLTFWMGADSKDRGKVWVPSFDVGLFMYVIWFLYLPYYLIRTRGRRGWVRILGLLGLVLLGTLLQLGLDAIDPQTRTVLGPTAER